MLLMNSGHGKDEEEEDSDRERILQLGLDVDTGHREEIFYPALQWSHIETTLVRLGQFSRYREVSA